MLTGFLHALQIVAASEVLKGAEVHNTYGELGNVDLVSKYGFALDDNPFSVVVLDKGSVLQAAERIMGVREMRLRCRFLRKERYATVWAGRVATLPVQTLSARSGHQSCLGSTFSQATLLQPAQSSCYPLTPATLLVVSFLMGIRSPSRYCHKAALDLRFSSPCSSSVLMASSSAAGVTLRMPYRASRKHNIHQHPTLLQAQLSMLRLGAETSKTAIRA